MTQQRFLESILYVLRYDFRDMLDDFPYLLYYFDGIPQHAPTQVSLTFENLFGCFDLNSHIVVYESIKINRDIKKELYKSLHDIIGDDGHLTDYGRWIADDTTSIIARVETDSFPFVTVQYFEITEDGIDEYKSHREDIRAYLDQEYTCAVLRYK